MPLFLKELKKEKRSAWLFYPNMPNRSEIKVCSVTVVRPEASEESVQRLLRAGLEQLAQEKHLILCFPNLDGIRMAIRKQISERSQPFRKR